MICCDACVFSRTSTNIDTDAIIVNTTWSASRLRESAAQDNHKTVPSHSITKAKNIIITTTTTISIMTMKSAAALVSFVALLLQQSLTCAAFVAPSTNVAATVSGTGFSRPAFTKTFMSSDDVSF